MSNSIMLALFCISLLAASQTGETQPPPPAPESGNKGGDQKPAYRAASVRYQVRDVDKAVEFYTNYLGFKLDPRYPKAPAFAAVSNGNLTLWLSGPKSSGSRALPDGRQQEPGGWNRIVLEVDDLASCVADLRKANLRFRNGILEGPGGMQIQLEDPDGNPVELFEPAR